jgi:hypothetical protein
MKSSSNSLPVALYSSVTAVNSTGKEVLHGLRLFWQTQWLTDCYYILIILKFTGLSVNGQDIKLTLFIVEHCAGKLHFVNSMNVISFLFKPDHKLCSNYFQMASDRTELQIVIVNKYIANEKHMIVLWQEKAGKVVD